MKKLIIILSLVLALSASMVGCNDGTDSNADTTPDSVNDAVTAVTETDTEADILEDDSLMYSYEGSLKFIGADGDFEVLYNDIYNTYESVSMNVHSVSSTGEESDDQVTGVLLDTILAEHGVSQKDFTAIRLIAGDGYEITVPAEVISAHDIILAYEFNGEGLEANKQPLRAAIDGVRSMYFVSNLVEIVFSDAVVETAPINNIVMLETAISALASEDYVYYESTDLAVTVVDLLESTGTTSEDDLFFVAADGYEKSEAMAVFREGYIKFTGEDAPLFIDPDIQKGMYIKSIMKAEAGDKTFVSVASAMTAFGTTEVNGVTGVAMAPFFDMIGIDADGYILTAIDGYQVEIAGENLSEGVFYIDDETGTASMKFAEGNPGSWNMKDILMIEAVGAASSTTDKEASEDSADITSAEWMIVFEGLSDGSFEFTSDRASSKITLVEVHTEKEKNDEKFPEDWTGYPVGEILDWLKVESYSSLTIIASDGYSVEIPASEIDDETILAITKDGEPLDSDNVVQLVQNTQFATTWIKGVATIIVNP